MRFPGKFTVLLFGATGLRRNYSAWPAAFVFTIILATAACTRQETPAPPDAATLLRALPAADSTKYPKQPAQHWSNPYLVVRADAVGLLSNAAANEEHILKPEAVLNALSQLPASAWPYGRAVAVLIDEKPDAPDADKVAIRRTRGIVSGDLQGANLVIYWVPPS